MLIISPRVAILLVGAAQLQVCAFERQLLLHGQFMRHALPPLPQKTTSGVIFVAAPFVFLLTAAHLFCTESGAKRIVES